MRVCFCTIRYICVRPRQTGWPVKESPEGVGSQGGRIFTTEKALLHRLDFVGCFCFLRWVRFAWCMLCAVVGIFLSRFTPAVSAVPPPVPFRLRSSRFLLALLVAVSPARTVAGSQMPQQPHPDTCPWRYPGP